MDNFTGLINFLRDLGIRLKSKNPKFHKILSYVVNFISVVVVALLGINEFFDLGWGLILVIGKIPITYILALIPVFCTGIFGGASTAISDKSINKEKLNLTDKVNDVTNENTTN